MTPSPFPEPTPFEAFIEEISKDILTVMGIPRRIVRRERERKAINGLTKETASYKVVK